MAKRRAHNEGALFQRADGRWAGSVDLGWRDGKRARKTVYDHTQQEAIAKMTQIKADLAKGIMPADGRVTVEVFLNRWLETTAKPRVRLSNAA
jgi:hypothetical protein